MSRIEIYNSNGSPKNPGYKKRGWIRNYTPEPSVITPIYPDIPDTDCSRFDPIVKGVMEFNAAIGSVHYQDQRFSKELRKQLALEMNLIHGVKV